MDEVKQVTIKMPVDEWKQIKKEADSVDKSLNQYLLKLIRTSPQRKVGETWR